MSKNTARHQLKSSRQGRCLGKADRFLQPANCSRRNLTAHTYGTRKWNSKIALSRDVQFVANDPVNGCFLKCFCRVAQHPKGLMVAAR